MLSGAPVCIASSTSASQISVGRPAPRKTDRRQILPPPPKDERPVYTGPPRKITLTEGVTVKGDEAPGTSV